MSKENTLPTKPEVEFISDWSLQRNPQNCTVLKIATESLRPLFEKGDIILVDNSSSRANGEIHIYLTGYGYLVCRYFIDGGVRTLEPIDQTFSVFGENDQAIFFGRVVAYFTASRQVISLESDTPFQSKSTPYSDVIPAVF